MENQFGNLFYLFTIFIKNPDSWTDYLKNMGWISLCVLIITNLKFYIEVGLIIRCVLIIKL